MGQKNNSPRTPTGDDGGDSKEAAFFSAKKKPKSNGVKKNPAPMPLRPPPPIKVQWFRCNNPSCLLNGQPNEWDVPFHSANLTDHCPECGSKAVEQITEQQRSFYQS